MSGGVAARIGYDYQDGCAVYFLLKHYLEETSFEKIYSEQDKLDFEVWTSNNFNAFQAKTRADTNAKEIWSILDFFIRKAGISEVSSKKKRLLFLFSKEPENSLLLLFKKLKKERGVAKYTKTTDKFIKTAMNGLMTQGLEIDYKFLSEYDLDCCLEGCLRKALYTKIKKGKHKLKAEMVLNFGARLIEEIKRISRITIDSDRCLSLIELESLLEEYLLTNGVTENSGEIKPFSVKRGAPKKTSISKTQSISENTLIPTEGTELI